MDALEVSVNCSPWSDHEAAGAWTAQAQNGIKVEEALRAGSLSQHQGKVMPVTSTSCGKERRPPGCPSMRDQPFCQPHITPCAPEWAPGRAEPRVQPAPVLQGKQSDGTHRASPRALPNQHDQAAPESGMGAKADG